MSELFFGDVSANIAFSLRLPSIKIRVKREFSIVVVPAVLVPTFHV